MLIASLAGADPPATSGPDPETAAEGAEHPCSEVGARATVEPAKLAAAREQHRAALELARAGRYASALEHWRQAYELSAEPVLLLNEAGAYRELGRPLDARGALLCFRTEVATYAPKACLDSIDAWMTRLSAVAATNGTSSATGASATGASATAAPSDSVAPPFSCPAERAGSDTRPAAAAPARPDATSSLSLGAPFAEPARQATPPRAEPPRAARPAPSLGSRRVVALALAGIGVAGVSVGAAYGFESMHDRDAADRQCTLGTTGDRCSPRGVELGNDAISAGNRSTLFFSVGLTALAAGAVLWLTAPVRQESTARLELGAVSSGSGFELAARRTW